MPNALLPSVTLIFLQVGTMISGAITVETVYSWPGLGYLTYQALQIPDLPLLEGTFIVFSASVIVFNLLADLLYRYSRPDGCDGHDRDQPRHRRHRGAAATDGTAPVRARSSPPSRARWSGLGILVAVTVLALAAPLFIHPSDLARGQRARRRRSPRPRRASRWAPTRRAGRCLTLLIWGTRPSLAIGVIATALTMILGSVIGLLAGHYGGRSPPGC